MGLTRRGSRRRRGALALVSTALVIGLAGCMADPPPPVRETLPQPTPAEYPTEKTIFIATGSIGGGFNPHIGADQSTLTTAIAAMTLPSAFAPVAGPDGVVRWEMQEDLLTSAEVTSTAPFTVTYRIHTDAQWSDGLPVTGDDFSYLWQQMSRQPNVVAPAGYRLIDSVQSREGGKVVEVSFARPYPAWRQMFTNLLPSHVLRGAPAGFQTGMDSGKPVSAGPYSVVSIDPTRDEVRLARNDRYWVKPPSLDQIVLRRTGTAPQMVESVRSGGSAIVDVGSGPAIAAELAAVPEIRTQRSLSARAMTVSVNARTETMSDVGVRQAVLGMINASLVTYAAAGDEIVEPYANTVYAPSDPGYTPVNRPRPSAAQVEALLADAGYRRGPVQESAEENPPAGASGQATGPDAEDDANAPSSSEVPTSADGDATEDQDAGDQDAGEQAPEEQTPEEQPAEDPAGEDENAELPAAADGPAADDIAPVPNGVAPFQREGEDLTVRVGAIAGDPRSRSAAATIVDQLRAGGVRATVVSLPNSELYGVALTNARVDLVVGWTGLGVPTTAALASHVDCDQPKPETAPSLSTPPTPESVAPGQTGPAVPEELFASNVSGLCDPELMELAREAMSAEDPAPLLAEAEPLLAEQAIFMPIYQDTTYTGVTDLVRNVPLTGPIQVGIYGDAVEWELP